MDPISAVDGLRIEVHWKNQYNKSKLVLYNL